MAKTELKKRLTIRFISVLQRWQNYQNIAPFIPLIVNRYQLIAGVEKYPIFKA